MKQKVLVDGSRPHLCSVVLPEDVHDDHIQAVFEQTLAVFKNRRRVVLLVNASSAKLSARQRKLMVSRMKEHEEQFRQWVACSAIVVSSAFARGTLTALLWMMTPPYEQKVFSDVTEARAWAEARARALQLSDQRV